MNTCGTKQGAHAQQADIVKSYILSPRNPPCWHAVLPHAGNFHDHEALMPMWNRPWLRGWTPPACAHISLQRLPFASDSMSQWHMSTREPQHTSLSTLGFASSPGLCFWFLCTASKLCQRGAICAKLLERSSSAPVSQTHIQCTLRLKIDVERTRRADTSSLTRCTPHAALFAHTVSSSTLINAHVLLLAAPHGCACGGVCMPLQGAILIKRPSGGDVGDDCVKIEERPLPKTCPAGKAVVKVELLSIDHSPNLDEHCLAVHAGDWPRYGGARIGCGDRGHDQ